MTTGQTFLKWIAIVLLCGTGLTMSFLMTRKPWVKPLVPGVQLSPTRPLLLSKDVDPNGAYGKLERACELLDAADVDPDMDLDDKAKANPLGGDIQTAMKLCEPGFAAVREALAVPSGRRAPCGVKDEDIPFPSKGRRACRLLQVSARYKAASGDVNGAAQDVMAAMEVGNLLGSGGALIHVLVDFAILGPASEALTELSWKYDLSGDQYRSYEAALVAIETNMPPLAEAYRYECAIGSNGVDELVQRPSSVLSD